MSYNIIIEKAAQKYLDKLSGKIYRSISVAISELAEEPRPHGITEVKPFENVYRIRKGDYRIIYKVEDDDLIILVLSIGSRGQIYSDF